MISAGISMKLVSVGINMKLISVGINMKLVSADIKHEAWLEAPTTSLRHILVSQTLQGPSNARLYSTVAKQLLHLEANRRLFSLPSRAGELFHANQ